MIQIKPHLQAVSDLHNAIHDMRELAEQLPESTDKGYLLANIDAFQSTAENYTDNTIRIYEKIMNFAMESAS